MTHSPYLLFHQTPEQLRRSGARGGKAQARNRRERLQLPSPLRSHILAPRLRRGGFVQRANTFGRGPSAAAPATMP